MALPLGPKHLKHYRRVAALLLRHWDSDAARLGGDAVEDTSGDPDPGTSLAQDLEGLGPTYVKLGQLLRTRPDLLSPEAFDSLSALHAKVEPFPTDDVHEVFRDEFAQPPSRLFAEFDERPLAAASLGQVHRARLRSGGEVAVKVQRPTADKQVREDLDVLKDVAEFISSHTELEERIGLSSTLVEFRQTILGELDYLREAENLRRMREIAHDPDTLRIPSVIDDLTSARILTMEFLDGTPLSGLHRVALLERPTEDLAEHLFRCYLEQALVHGFVHTDPHPGNVLLTPDNALALVDLGQVTIVPNALRERILELLLAVANGEGSAAAAIAERIGTPLKRYDRDGFRGQLARIVAREHGKSADAAKLGSLLIDVARMSMEHGLRIPAQLAVLGKTLLNLEEVAAILHPRFEAAPAIQRYAPTLVAHSVADELDPGSVFRKGLQAKRLADSLPGRLDAILETVSEGEFRVQMQIEGEDRIVKAMRQMANRVTSGLVLASLVVGAALLMRVETDFTLLGYPGVALLFFILASVGGAHLLWQVWSTRDIE